MVYLLYIQHQFDPETFVDSLLGIGKAGGKADSSLKDSEAVMLANRLKEMRKLRDERSKALQLESSVTSAGNQSFNQVAVPAASFASKKNNNPLPNSSTRTTRKKKQKGK